MFNEGETNAELDTAWTNMPGHAGEKYTLASQLNANVLLPGSHDYYRFNGSLTTPPCSEGVLWLVMKQFATVSKEQIDTFMQTIKHPNNRQVQPVNARLIPF